MNRTDYIQHLKDEFKRLVMRTNSESEVMILLESLLVDAYSTGANQERKNHVAEDCFGG